MIPSLDHARQDEPDIGDKDWAYFDRLPEKPESDATTMLGWVIVYMALCGIAAIIWIFRP